MNNDYPIAAFLLNAIVILLSACSSSKNADPVISYHCSDGTEAIISFSGEKAHLSATLNGKTYDLDLPHVQSVSGARYANDSVSVWGKGKEMMIEAGGVTYNCAEGK